MQNVHEQIKAEVNELQLHPLLIDLVLENTFPYLSSRDTLSCRLVCLKWNQIILQQKIHSYGVTFRPNQVKKKSMLNRMSRFLHKKKVQEKRQKQKKYPNEENSLLPDFIDYASNSPSILFSHFTFRSIKMDMDREILSDFFSCWGHHIRMLTLDFRGMPPGIKGENLFPVATLLECPNLEKLTVLKVSVSGKKLGWDNVTLLITKTPTGNLYQIQKEEHSKGP